MSERRVTALLGFLVAFDVTLTTWAFGFPELWFTVFHGTAYDDPQGFLRRCGANWAAFAVFNALGLETLLHPAVAAWTPNVLFGLLGSTLLLYVRT